MEPRIIYKPAFTVIGICANGDSADHTEALWDELGRRYCEIPGVDPDVGFGVHSFSNGGRSYLAGLALGSGAQTVEVPGDMTALKIEAHVYAVFTHTGLLIHLPNTVGLIFEGWLPDSGYETGGDFYFEYFDDRFSPGSPDSVVFLWLPVCSAS